MIHLKAAMRAILIATVLLSGHLTYGVTWHYQDEENWPQSCKEGKNQSPIALYAANATLIDYKSFSLVGSDKSVTATVTNTRYSAEITLPYISGDEPSVSGGGLNYTYILDNLHFHWQSEHVIDQYRFPLEMHLVHYAKEFGSVEEALKQKEGIAVFAVLFDLSSNDNEKFEPLVKIIDVVKDKVDQPVNLTNFVLNNFLPTNVDGYYRYEGSLTTPDCNEGIIWTVFTDTISISKRQVQVFYEMQSEDHKILNQTYRSLQPLNGRNVYLKNSSETYNYDIKNHHLG